MRGTGVGCPRPLSVIALGPDDAHVKDCLNCCALYESVQAAAATAHTLYDALDCDAARALVNEVAVADVPSIEALANVLTHTTKCSSCRGELTLSTTLLGAPSRIETKGDAARVLVRGDKLGRFEITGRLGEGGMGVVVSAYDPDLDRSVALKVVHQDRFRGRRAEQAERRLVREAQAMAKIRHPNVITVYEVGKVDDQVYIAMEQVSGTTLGQWLKTTKRSWDEILQAFRAAGNGLAAAHAAGLIHRDFKPENVLVSNDGGIYVTDFGLAAAPNENTPTPVPQTRPATAPTPILQTSLTQTGELLGTPKYMAPEQHRASPTDARTDQFSFCVALYEALYGCLPYQGETVAMLMLNVTNGVFAEPPKSTSVPEWIRPILLRGLATEASERHPSMKELVERLEVPATKSSKRLRIAAVVGGAALVGTLVAVAVIRTQSVAGSQCEGAELRLTGVWDAQTKEGLRKVFSAAGPAYAVDTLERLDEIIKKYTAEWVAAQTDACTAARDGQESKEMHDRRVSCLDRHRLTLQSLIAVWRSADRGVIANAITAARQLPPAIDCSAGRLALSSEAKLTNPEQQRQRETLEAQLVEAQALLHTGKYRDGIKIAQDAQPAMAVLGHAPLTAEMLLTLGQLQWRAGQMSDSVATLERAYDAAETAGSPRFKALVGNELTYVHASERQDFDEAQKWAGRSRASLKNLGGDPALEAELLRSVGIAQNKSGRFPEALKSFQESLAIREKLYGPERVEVAFSLASTAVPMIALGDGAGAIANLKRAIGIAEHEFGKEHPELGDLYNNLGVAHASLGDFESARTYYTRAITIQENALGPETVKLADALTNLGTLVLEEEQYDTAAKYIERAAQLEEKAYGENNVALGITLTHLANVRAAQGQHEEALTIVRRAIAIHRKVSHPNLPTELAIAGRSAFELAKKKFSADRAGARALVEQALADLKESGADAADLLADVEDWDEAHR